MSALRIIATPPLGSVQGVTGQSSADRVFVVLDGGDDAIELVQFGHAISRSAGLTWEALYVETPEVMPLTANSVTLEALSLAASLGALVHRISGTTMADALSEHMAPFRHPHVILPVRTRRPLKRLWQASLMEKLALCSPNIIFHAVAQSAKDPGTRSFAREPATAKELLIATIAVLLTAALAVLLNRFTGAVYLSILFLFPVITISARSGIIPAALSAALSTAAFNILFLRPTAQFDLWSVQSWIMGSVLMGVAVYTSWLTGKLRGRIAMSDRNAHESAVLAAFAQELTRVADWSATADVVCDEVSRMLGVNAILAREISGRLEIVSSTPRDIALDPIDTAALDLAWANGNATGSGTPFLPSANWQFHPLKTSLGSLAVLGLANENGRNPVSPEQQVLLATIIAQAALAHERLRLEDANPARH